MLFGLMTKIWNTSNQPNASIPTRPAGCCSSSDSSLYSLTGTVLRMANLTLSHQHSLDDSPSSPDTIVPSSCMVTVLTWELQNIITEAQCTQPEPPAISSSLIQPVLQSFSGSTHPIFHAPPQGATQVQSLLQPSHSLLPYFIYTVNKGAQLSLFCHLCPVFGFDGYHQP